ncbi:hypothetical protein [Kitasatospora sp. NPDC088783]|uniref:hypothetical protein n=1 Tax=Kitasatospora sp. NPDC088783 TaxID=3364077 RepID=UPI0038256CCE
MTAHHAPLLAQARGTMPVGSSQSACIAFNRNRKAYATAQELYAARRGDLPDDLNTITDAEMDAAAYAAGVNPPQSATTRDQVRGQLAILAGVANDQARPHPKSDPSALAAQLAAIARSTGTTLLVFSG